MAQWSASYTHVLHPQVDGLTFELSHVEGLNKQVPRGEYFGLPPNGGGFDKKTKTFARDNADYSLAPAERYIENQLYLNYTRRLPFNLETTLGVSYYSFSDGRWWQQGGKGDPEIDDTIETQIRLKYYGLKFSSDATAIPLVVPSVGYAVDWRGFKGEFLDFGLESAPIPLHLGPALLSFRAGAGYDFGYNSPGDGWNHLSGGVSLIVPLDGTKTFGGSGLEFKVSADYIHALDKDRADEGWFFGVGLGTSQAIRPGDSKIAAMASKDPLSLAAAPDHKWEVGIGTGFRTWNADFRNNAATPYNSLLLIDKQVGSGDLGFAANGRPARYKNGTVTGSTNGSGSFYDGTSQFTTRNGGQIRGSAATGDRHVIYDSDRYSYDQEVSSRSFSTSTDQEIVSPFLEVSRDISPASWKAKGMHLKLGAIYAYSNGEFDSGTQLTSLSSGFETTDKYQFIYTVDEIFTDPDLTQPHGGGNGAYVVVNGQDYADNYGASLSGSGPQSTHTGVRNNLSRVASFSSSSLSISAHELAFPQLEFEVDLGTRWHLGLKVAPTLSLLEGKLASDVYYQELSDLAAGKVTANKTGYSVFKFASASGGFDDDEDQIKTTGGNNPSGTSGSSAAGAAPATAPQGSASANGSPSGKGSRAVASRLPGRTLAHYHDSTSSQEFAWGLQTRANVRFDLDEQDRFFLEAWAGYHYMDKVTFSNRFSSVTLDPSNWELGLGLGCRF